MNKSKKNLIWLPIVTALLSLFVLSYSTLRTKSNINKQYSSFLSDITNQNISEVIMNKNSNLTVVLKDGTKYSTDNPNSPTLKETLLSSNIKVMDEFSPPLTKTISAALLVISLVSIAFMVINKSKIGTS